MTRSGGLVAVSQDLGRPGGCSPGPGRSGQLGVGAEGCRNHQSRALRGSARGDGKVL